MHTVEEELSEVAGIRWYPLAARREHSLLAAEDAWRMDLYVRVVVAVRDECGK